MHNHDFNRAILDDVAHRPWPMPNGRWLMTQTWHDLLFAHWRVEPAVLRGRVPAAFDVDVRDGAAWLGVVAFHMSNVAPRGVPSLPWLSVFPELNVRTYVTVDDRPGIYFFSLDAGNAVAAHAAHALLNLPYHAASMRADVAPDGTVTYSSRRGAAAAAAFDATYRPAGAVFTAAPGTLEYFLTERYCLYHLDQRGTPYRLEIHHPAWPLQPAEGQLHARGLFEANGIPWRDEAPLLHYAKRQDMVAWAPTMLADTRGVA